MSILVSIILPTFNRREELKKAINSVIDQTYTNWELIIIDNFSSDETKENINKFNDKRIKFYQIKNNGIIAKSRNYGIDKASGEIISFLDSDDWWNKDKLHKSLEYMSKGYDFTFHRLVKHNIKKKYLFAKKTYAYKLKYPIFENLIRGGNCIPNSSVSVNRKLILEIGKFNESEKLVGAEDFDGWLRISKLTNKFIEIPKALGYCTIGESNFSNDKNLLRNIQTLEELHLKDNCKIIISASFYYQRARISQRKKSYQMAFKFYRTALKNKPTTSIFIRSLLGIFMIGVLSIYKYKN